MQIDDGTATQQAKSDDVGTEDKTGKKAALELKCQHLRAKLRTLFDAHLTNHKSKDTGKDGDDLEPATAMPASALR